MRNCKEAKVSVSTVSYTIKRHVETEGNSDRKRSGRPKATTQSEYKFLRVNSLCVRNAGDLHLDGTRTETSRLSRSLRLRLPSGVLSPSPVGPDYLIGY